MAMKVQSTSVLASKICKNNCKFCSSRMRKDVKEDINDKRWVGHEFKKRLAFTKDSGSNTLIITGTGEPLMDIDSLINIAATNRDLVSPYRWIEIQTSGITNDGHLDEATLKFLYETVNVTTVSLSLSDIFDDENNLEINGTPDKHKFEMEKVCKNIKSRFNLRLSLNISDVYNDIEFDDIFARALELGADQLTFRKLYYDNNGSKASNWVMMHDVDDDFWMNLSFYVKSRGNELETLPFGAVKYSLHGISVVIDDNCMTNAAYVVNGQVNAPTPKDVYKYLIIDNGKIYSRWDDKGSLIF